MVTISMEFAAIPQARLDPIANLHELGQVLPVEAVRYFSEGIKLTEVGKYEEAVASYIHGVKLAPSVPQAWYNMGTALGELGKYSEALEALDRATELMPDYVEAWHNKGVAFKHLGRHDDALNAFRRILGQRPDDARASQSIGSVLLAQQKTEEALSAFQEALGSGGDSSVIRMSVGVTLGILRRYADANLEFQKAYEAKEKDLIVKTTLYKAWATSTLSLGVIALIDQDIKAFEEAGFAYIAIAEKSQQDQAGDQVEAVLTDFRTAFQGKKRRKFLKAFEELELFIKLMMIKDPYEGWRAIGKAMSERWPRGLSAVEAVREMRK